MRRLMQTVAAGQNAGLKPGQTLRLAPRINRTLSLELLSSNARHKTVTLDIGMGGFSALLHPAFPHDGPLTADILLRGRERVQVPVRVAGARTQRGTARVSFAFETLGTAESARLKAFMEDEVVLRFTG